MRGETVCSKEDQKRAIQIVGLFPSSEFLVVDIWRNFDVKKKWVVRM
jgi:hypothetical protein